VSVIKPSERHTLANSYKQLLAKLTRDLLFHLGNETGSFSSYRYSMNNLIERLRTKTESWAMKNIPRTVDKAIRQAIQGSNSLRPATSDLDLRQLEMMRSDAIRSLLWDPGYGFLVTVESALGAIHYNLRRIEQMMDAGLDADSIRSLFMDIYELAGVKPMNFAGNQRSVRIDRFIESLAQTKITQAFNIGQRIGALISGHQVMLVSNSTTDPQGVCSLYSGRVFAITQQTAEILSIPPINSIPAGGAPISPICGHREIMFYPEFMAPAQVDAAFTRPPDWSLNVPLAVAQSQYEMHGGYAFAEQQNPNLQFAGKSRWSPKAEKRRMDKLRRRARARRK
jgi:hypothetical protein